MERWTNLETPHGPVRAWRCDPSGPSRGAVLVIQEIFGVNAHIRDVTARMAAEGFIAVAPALFDVVESGVELPYDQAGIARGLALRSATGFDRAVDVLGAASHALQREGLRVGASGFCWGGTLALLTNTRLGLPAVSWYGGSNVPFLDEPLRAPMLFHFGARDRSIPPEHVELHRQRHPGATIHVYPDAGHGFNCGPRKDYEPESARLAWSRTVAFLTENLR